MDIAGRVAAAATSRALPVRAWAGLIEAIEASLDVEESGQLREWVRECVSGVLPHRHFYCALGPIAGARLRERFVAGDGGLDRYLASHRQSPGELATPAFRHWLDRNAPQTETDLEVRERSSLRDAGLDRLLAFGFVDRAGGSSSYCELEGVRAPPGGECVHAAELLAPYLHATLVRVASRSLDCAPAAPVAPGAPVAGRLTPREKEVLRWISEGKSVWETAVILGRSEHTIKNQVRRVYTKLGIHTRVQAARLADRLLGDGGAPG
jgi:DNA-binding CsgD family transcriptional regulator